MTTTAPGWRCRIHWYAYYGFVGSSAPSCVRCGNPNPNYDPIRDPKASTR